MVNISGSKPIKRYTVYEIVDKVLGFFSLRGSYMGRMRGGLMCSSPEGIFLVEEFSGNREKFLAREQVLIRLKEMGIPVNYSVCNRDGEFFCELEDGNVYTVCHFCGMEECNEKKLNDVCTALRALAHLHNALRELSTDPVTEGTTDFQIARSLVKEYDRHNKELKMIRNYLSARRTKTDFELLAAKECQNYLSEGEEALAMLKKSCYQRHFDRAVAEKTLCHGDFTYHNIYVDDNEYLIAGFSQMKIDIPSADLYLFMRKMMEKYDYDIKLGYLMLTEYDSVRTLSGEEISILGIMFSYPEKFWKILNFYFNGNKAWSSKKNYDKLKAVVDRNRLRQEFAKTML